MAVSVDQIRVNFDVNLAEFNKLLASFDKLKLSTQDLTAMSKVYAATHKAALAEMLANQKAHDASLNASANRQREKQSNDSKIRIAEESATTKILIAEDAAATKQKVLNEGVKQAAINTSILKQKEEIAVIKTIEAEEANAAKISKLTSDAKQDEIKQTTLKRKEESAEIIRNTNLSKLGSQQTKASEDIKQAEIRTTTLRHKEDTAEIAKEAAASRLAAQQVKASEAAKQAAIKKSTLAREAESAATQGFGKSVGLVNGLIRAYAAIVAVSFFGTFVKGIFEAQSSIESLRLSLKNLTGDQAIANDIFRQFENFVVTSPFQFEDSLNGLQQLIGSFKGVGASAEEMRDDIIPIFESLGNSAAALGGGDRLKRLIYAFTQVQATGRLMGTELRQINETGLPLLSILAEKAGISTGELLSEMRKGKIDFAQFKEAVLEAGNAGGIFSGSMKILVETVQGRLSNLVDTFFFAKARLGEFFKDSAISAIASASRFIESFTSTDAAISNVISKVTNLVVAFASYRVAIGLLQAREALLNTERLVSLRLFALNVLGLGQGTAATIALTAAKTALIAANRDLAFIQALYGNSSSAATTATLVQAEATIALANAKRVAALETAKLSAAMKGNLILLGVTAAVYLAIKAWDNWTDARNRVNEVNLDWIKTHNDQIVALETQKIKVQAAIKYTEGLTEGSERYRAKITEIIEEYPDYFRGLSTSTSMTGDLTKAYNRLNPQIDRTIKLMALQARQTAYGKQLESTIEKFDRFKSSIKGLEGIDITSTTKQLKEAMGLTGTGIGASFANGLNPAFASLQVLMREMENFRSLNDKMQAGSTETTRQYKINSIAQLDVIKSTNTDKIVSESARALKVLEIQKDSSNAIKKLQENTNARLKKLDEDLALAKSDILNGVAKDFAESVANEEKKTAETDAILIGLEEETVAKKAAVKAEFYKNNAQLLAESLEIEAKLGKESKANELAALAYQTSAELEELKQKLSLKHISQKKYTDDALDLSNKFKLEEQSINEKYAKIEAEVEKKRIEDDEKRRKAHRDYILKLSENLFKLKQEGIKLQKEIDDDNELLSRLSLADSEEAKVAIIKQFNKEKYEEAVAQGKKELKLLEMEAKGLRLEQESNFDDNWMAREKRLADIAVLTEEHNVELLKLQKDYNKDSSDSQKKDDKQEIKDREANFKLLIKLKKNFDNANFESQKKYGKDLKDLTNQELKDLLDSLTEKTAAWKKHIGAINAISSALFSIFEKNIKKNADAAVTEVDKANVKMQESWLEVSKTAVGAMNDLASGDLLGAMIKGVKVFFGALDNLMTKNAQLTEARLKDLTASLKASGEEFLRFADMFTENIDTSSIDKVYKTLLGITELPPVRIDLGVNDSFERRINQEIKIGEYINSNYETAIDAENDLHKLKSDNITETYNADVTSTNAKSKLAREKIQEDYNAEVLKIKGVYDLEESRVRGIYDLKTQQRKEAFSAESIGIQAGVNAELFGFIQNNDAKLALTSDYEGRKANIVSAFAAQIVPITEGMTIAEIAGINAAIAARDTALGNLEQWYTAEIQFFLDNNKLRADSYTATEAIIQKGKDDTYNLGLTYAAKEIADNALRDSAFEIALGIKNAGILAQDTKLKDDLLANAHKLEGDLVKLDDKRKADLTAETDRFNAVILKLGVDRDILLAESFTILKNLVSSGYDDMIAKAQEAFNAGKITADQFNDLSAKLFNLQNQVNGFDLGTINAALAALNGLGVTTTPNSTEIDWSTLDFSAFKLPSFDVGTDNTSLASSGSMTVDNKGGYLAKLHRNEAILNANEMNTLTKANGGVRPTRQDIIGRFTANNTLPYQNITKTMNHNSPYVIEKKSEANNRLSKDISNLVKQLKNTPQESFHVNMNEAGFSKYLLTKGSKQNKLNSRYVK